MMDSFLPTRKERHTRLCELADVVGLDLMINIAQAVCRARGKHPQFASCFNEGMHAVESEFCEFKAQAILAQRDNRSLRQERVQKSEAELVDLIVTAIRQLSREYVEFPNITFVVGAKEAAQSKEGRG